MATFTDSGLDSHKISCLRRPVLVGARRVRPSGPWPRRGRDGEGGLRRSRELLHVSQRNLPLLARFGGARPHLLMLDDYSSSIVLASRNLEAARWDERAGKLQNLGKNLG
jgi:hypothetical protein